MIFDLTDLIYFENDEMPEEGGNFMTDLNVGQRPQTTVTGDFNVTTSRGNPETLILFAAYPARSISTRQI